MRKPSRSDAPWCLGADPRMLRLLSAWLLIPLATAGADQSQVAGRPAGGLPADQALAAVSLEQPIVAGMADDWIAADASGALGGPAACGACGTFCDPMAHCGWGLWGSAEYLLWWEKGSQLPPLVTTSTGTPNRENAGVLGFPRTRILFGDETVDDNTLSGFRMMLGTWLDGAHTTGFGARYFTMGQRNVGFSGSSPDYQILARPFFDVIADRQNALLLAFPDDLEGGVDARLSGNAWGWEGFLRWLRKQGCNYRIDLIGGYRYLKLEEELSIRDRFEVIDPQDINFGRQEIDRDFFGTRNTFNGADIGLAGESQQGRWSLDFLAKVAVGNMRQVIDIRGSNTVQIPGTAPTTAVGGLLAQQTNIGSYTADEFVWIPEVDVNLGYALTSSLDVTLGYTFLYITDVVQPAAQIDPAVNLTQRVGELIGPAQPALTIRSTDYWLQGLNFGLSWRF